MGVPNVFGSATTSIPLSQLDANFNTGLTIGNTTIGLGNTTTTLGNVTLSNVSIVSSPNANVTIGNTTIGIGNTATSLGNVTLANSTINFAASLSLGNSTVNTALGQGNASAMKNRIINGAMLISQRGTSFASSSVTNGDYQLDRWSTWCNNGSANATVAQSSTAPAGFANSLLFTNVTAVTVGSADRAQLIQPIEGFNFYDLGFGTANAKTVTLSFWVNCSLTGQFGGSLQNYAGNRSYPFAYTITAANTWQQVSITIAGDTSGTWVGASNAGSAQLNFDLGCGSTLKGTAGSWAASNYRGATGDVNLTANAGATFYITGVQLEVGSSATGFEYVNYQTSLANCQRYFAVLASGNAQGVFNGFVSATTSLEGIANFPVQMRTTPTLSVTTGTAYYKVYTQSATSNATALAIDTGVASQYSVSLYVSSGASGLTNGQGGLAYTGSASSFVAVQAEL